MKFVITVMTANRSLSKAITRLSPYFDQLKKKFGSYVLNDEPYNDVIVVFVDEDQDFIKEVKNKDRIYQVNVGTIPIQSDGLSSDESLLHTLVEQLRRIINLSPFRESNKTEILNRISDWQTSFQKQSLRIVK